MSMDRITEIIAHFIGDFALSDEIGRIRADYEDIPVLPEPDPEREALDFQGLRLTPTHEIEDLDPQIVYQPLPPSPFAIPVAPPQPLPGPEHVIEVVSGLTLRIEMAPVTQMARPEPMTGIEIPPPSSVAAMLWMSNRLEDADAFGLADAAGMALAADLADMLQVLSEQLASLSPLPSPFEALSGSSIGALDWAELTAEITEAAAQLATSPLGGVVLQGGETLGVHVDGVVAETLPDWHDLLPAFSVRRRMRRRPTRSPRTKRVPTMMRWRAIARTTTPPAPKPPVMAWSRRAMPAIRRRPSRPWCRARSPTSTRR
ncbi:mucin-like protein 1 precursor [Limimaricola cinnabarinus LL-001]|uniref:Mucin-like protein 1 n=1 Tax=Limimaricola cinnabarinus LL-001 TaxID=1337093 RepID=U3APU4_9RHOB|nr:mucin-like protein 1 precursor [Limimaricola cinnabarinus LL-001]